MRRAYCAIFFIQCIFLNTCLGELTVEKKQEFLNRFIESLNNQPDKSYIYEEGVFVDAQKTNEDNTYKITVRLKVSDIHDIDVVKILKCSVSVLDGGNGVVVQNEHQCEEDPDGSLGDGQDSVDGSTESPAEAVTGPVQLANEVTSGEQFVAVPRPSAPCIGCATHVDPTATGVPEMAHLGIRHLDLHDPGSKHSLKSVVDVVNGVRYILTLLVDFNNCTAPSVEPCPVSTPCKISILEKPWKKLPDGSKYRAILANNCTAEWLFGDEGEVLPSERNSENNELYPDSSGNFDDDLRVVHNFDTQAQPNQEKTLTDDMVKSVEDQIIPFSEFKTPEGPGTASVAESSAPTLENTEHVHEDETVKHYVEESAPAPQSHINQPNSLNEDQRRAIDDMMNFFNFAGFHKPSDDHQRNKRSYSDDLKVLDLAKKFQKMKRSIDHANYVHKLARFMVEYLNEHDMFVKNRILKDVLAAEQEIENDKHFFYLQALITIPCDSEHCKEKEYSRKICNGVIDGSNKTFPQILNTFCYDDEKEILSRKSKTIPFDDPILAKLAKRALIKIESQSTKDQAMRILKILDATTQNTLGRLTRISMLLSYTNCKKTLDFNKRLNCSTIEDLGSEICDVTIHERINKKNEMKINYICNERGIHESFVDTEHSNKKNKNLNDPEIQNMIQEALQFLEKQSNINKKQKLVSIKSISTKVVAGLVTEVAFTVGYSDCQNDENVDINTCQLLLNEAIRECKAQVWDRPWLENGRQVNVKCENEPIVIPAEVEHKQIPKKYVKFGKVTERNPNDIKYKQLAEESLQKYLESVGISLGQTLVQVSGVTTQVVSGLITEIDFDVYPTNGDVFDCHSKIWDQPLLNKKDITVDCNMFGQKRRVKRQIDGGITQQDPSKPEYKALAEESLLKYLQTSGGTLTERKIEVNKVTEQVVAGSLTRIDFTVRPLNGDSFTCHSKVWEQPWVNKKDITVKCNINEKQTRVKRHVPGGQTEKDPSKPEYKALAEESLQKYLQTSGDTLTETEVEVNKVTVQVVAGSLTRIDFTVRPLNGDSFTCHSEVWEQPWLNKKEIDVNCNINEQRLKVKRQLIGGQIEKDPSKPEYKALAEESLQKYLQTSGGTLTETKIDVNKVTVQVVAGFLTRIDFTVRPLNGDSFTCHSKVWEQAWLNKKDITVNCDINDKQTRAKRQIPGGQTEKDPRKPEYKALAEESLQKYLQTSGSILDERKIEVTKVTTQVVSGSKTSIDFTVHPLNGDSFTCHSEVWEQSWLKKKDITVNCNLNDKQTRVKRQIIGGETENDPSKPEYKALAEESLQKYLQTSGSILDERKIEVTKVTTQVVSGSKTRIDFTVHPLNGDSFTCHSEVWEQSWLKKKDITVNCNINDKQTRVKRQIPGGQTEKDPSKPEYKALAEESLQKYLQTSGSILDERKIEVTKVTTQVVSGSKTRIDFTVHPLNGDSFTCHSEVWEQSWLKKKDITVNCNLNDNQTRVKRQIIGGENENDPSKPEYKALAEESLQKYLQTSGSILEERKIEVTKVTTQVVSGSKTRIDFTVHPLNGDSFTCHSEVWEQAWLNKKDITVNCNINDKQTRVKRRIPGGQTEKDPSKPEYKALAEESLQKYLQTSGSILDERKIEVTKVTTQVVSGSKTSIDFTVHPLNGDSFTCHSEVWEQSWLKKKDITVNCNLNDNQTRVKRQIIGGENENDPSKPEYKALAEESLQKYLQTSGSILEERKIEVTKVTTQVVSGSKTRIDFTVHPLNGDSFTCHSEVWEQAWLNKKDITVNCNINDKQTRVKRQIPGGQIEKDPRKPEYKALAEESLQKYLQTSGSILDERKIEVTKVTTQVVSGSKTSIDFTVHPLNGDSFTCHSEVWEQSWLKKKDITVNCNLNDKQTRVKRQIIGGETENDPSKPEYKALAEESLQKYLQTSGSILDERKIEVTKVTTQVVSGSKTRIDFTVHPLNGDSFTCHSEVWEQSWLKKKDITVNCNRNDKQTRVKRQSIGGETEKDPSKPEYKALAEESLQKYLQNSGGVLNVRKIDVIRVTSQVVSGSMTRIAFIVHPLNGDSFTCHSEVWEQPWINKNDITVMCGPSDQLNRKKREMIGGGLIEPDLSDRKYHVLAEESLQKYLHNSGGTLGERKIEVTKVTVQVVSGVFTGLEFDVLPANGDSFSCRSEVLEQTWANKKEINVDCHIDKRRKREIAGVSRRRGSPQEEDSSKPEYKALAEKSLQKYLKLQNKKTRHDVLEVKHVTSQVVAGRLYEIDFTASPTRCSNNDIFLSECGANNETVLFCHSKIWSRVWLKSNKIEVICNTDTHENLNDETFDEDKKKRSLVVTSNEERQPKDITKVLNDELKGKPVGIQVKPFGSQDDKFNYKGNRDLAQEAILKFERLSNAKYMHKLLKIHRVSEQINEGILTTIEFSMSPTECLIGNAINVNDCKFKEPKIEFLCLSTIWERSWIYLKDIKVSCKNRKSKHANPTEWDDEIPGARQIEREKRQLREDDDYIEDDLTFYYADRAVKEINDRSQSHNLQKLITVHAIDDTMQMGARMIRMYIETAVTFCLRPQAGVQLSECEEIDGLNRRLCLVRLWPDPDDELVVQHVAVVCDDDSDFASVTGISIPILITASIKEIEKAQNIKFKLVHQGEPNIVPTLSSKHPIKMNFIVASTNCSKDVDVYKHRDTCFVDTAKSPTACESMTWLVPNSMEVKDVTVKCYGNTVDRKKRSANINTDKASIDITIGKLVDESLEKLEASSAHRYKQRVFQINTYSTKIQKGRVTTIDFDVGFTSCLKYEYVANISSCEFIEHLPRRHCVSHVFERLWVENGRNIEVICEDDESPLEPHVGLESSEMAMELAKEAVKHIEAKYPYPRRLKVVRIFSLEKQALAGIHYRMKIEVGVTDCMALSVKSDCKLKQDGNSNKFCRVNVWIRPWTEHAPNFRVWCDYQESLTTEHHHMLQAEQLFYDFLTTYSPDYVDNYTEMAKRFTIFRANVRKVHELNVHERGTARYAMTRFSDLTYKEFTSKYLGLRPDLKNANNIPLVKAEIPEVQLPDKFDWRDHGAVTEVKNQGSCGSCWAFSGEDDKCVFNKTIAKVQISGAVNISSNETDMAKWLVGNGPISIGINANAMQFYVGGISHPWKMLCSPTNLDHGVLIVGFGAKDYPLFHKHLPYWVIKNSWGKQWGEQGYYRVYRGDGTCGVNQMASSAVV
ncbi:hypothetical protein MSG28_007122 [Choristoneura fumiferana]|uniref:Uncharacterized protein n=2 Tax=Choristoneura fumiferana TaxID=7141 RepID=A0ACC0JMI2_CHOFU|nr:hypothetical protein MSG28_007122 [Choristoneura fumiferana]